MGCMACAISWKYLFDIIKYSFFMWKTCKEVKQLAQKFKQISIRISAMISHSFQSNL